MRPTVALFGTILLVLLTVFLAGPVPAQEGAPRDLLPSGSSTMVVTNDGTRTPAEYAEIFFDPEEAARLLADWGCQENAFRVYEDTQATGGGAKRPYLQVGVTRFASPDGASAVLPYIVENLRPAGAHREIPMSTTIGDESRQFVAEADEGIDLTLLVRSDSLLIGISTLLTEGDPTFDPVQVAEGIIARAAAPPTPASTGMTFPQWDVAPLLEAVPPDLPDCLRLTDEEPFDFQTVVTRFPGVPDAATRLEELRWRTGAHHQYTCDPLPAMGVSWLDMSVHGFADEASATAAVPFLAEARTVGTQLVRAPAMELGESTAAIVGPSENGTEYTLYLSTGRLVFRVSAVAAHESPQADVEYVMTALMVNAQSDDAAAPPQAHNLKPVTQTTEVPPVAEDHSDAPYLTLDQTTGQPVAIYPDGTVVPVDNTNTPAMTTGATVPQGAETPTAPAGEPLWVVTPTSLADQIECESTPSKCSLQYGVPDWTSPAYGCDWNYGTSPEGCVPDQQGDYDCPDLHAMGLWDIRVIGDDWMLLDEDGDGFGCELNRDALEAEAARCDSLYEPERTACYDVLREPYTVYQSIEEANSMPDPDYDDQYDPDDGDYYDPYEQDPAEFCPRC